MKIKCCLSKKVVALVLCVLLLISSFSSIAGAITTDLAQTSANENVWTVTGLNHYTTDTYYTNTVSIVQGESAQERVANGTFPDGAEYTWHTAFVIEQIGNQGLGAGTNYEFIVDAVVTGTDVKKDHLKAKTTEGFVLYILNDSRYVEIEKFPKRGDLVWSSFWVSNTPSQYQEGGLGTLTFIDNPSADRTVNTVNVDDVEANAKVNIYNYDSNINNTDSGFYFWNGDWGKGASVESVDGAGIDSDIDLKNERHLIDEELDANGYPTFEGGKSLAYLYDGSSKRNDGSSTLIGTMNDGGGLFREIDGYYYYDSLYNATYYDEATNRFELYDNTIVRPWYNTDNSTKTAYGNFLPFNKVTADNILIDNTITYNQNARDTFAQGSIPPSDVHRFTDVLGREGVIQSAHLEEKLDLWFGMTMDLEFIQPRYGKLDSGNNMTFEFFGDDDVLVYLGVYNEETNKYDYKLTLDIGGVHGARSGKIDFATGVVTDFPDTLDGTTANNAPRTRTLKDIFGLENATFEDYTELSLKFFYLERGGNISYCGIGYNIPAIPQTPLNVTKTVESEVDVFDNINPYTFRVVQADSNGNATDIPLLTNSTYDIIENNAHIGVGNVDENGYFTLMSGQTASFSSMFSATNEGKIKYIVQEIVGDDVINQYSSIGNYVISSSAISPNSEENSAVYNKQTTALSGEDSQSVVFVNEVDESKIGTLTIEKNAKDSAVIPSDVSFDMLVKLGDAPLPVGTQYYIDDDKDTVYTVEKEGIIPLKVNQKATLVKGLLVGTEFSVEELEVEGYTPAYSGVIVTDGESKDLVGSTTDVSGVMTLGGKAVATVTNDDNIIRVIFHANNEDIDYDVFRTYYEYDVDISGENIFSLKQDGSLDSFYDIPEFEYKTHNNYVFKGWYLDKDSDARPITWNEKYTEDTDIYARWILAEEVNKDATDTKLTQYGKAYPGYDLIGVQIRDILEENDDHHGTPGSGLRFVTVLSNDVYSQINALSSKNASGAEYGYALAKTATAQKYAGNTEGYELQYNASNVNGVDTTTSYKYVANVKCSGVPDHFNASGYRLYTAVVTFNNKEGDALLEAHAQELLARSYIRYTDANGLLRTHYNNYISTNQPNGTYSGCSASFDDANELVNPVVQ